MIHACDVLFGRRGRDQGAQKARNFPAAHEPPGLVEAEEPSRLLNGPFFGLHFESETAGECPKGASWRR